MSTITWITKKGNLGTVPESQFFSQQFEAVDSDAQPLIYSFISGELPGGMYITRLGELRGVPTILSPVSQTAVYAFTVRAINPQGRVADRSFSISVSNIAGPQILPRPNLVGAFFDGEYLEYQFASINDNPVATQTWSVLAGNIPPGTTLSSDGKLSGYLDIVASNTDLLGFEATGIESVVYDVLPESTDRNYNFTVQVSDGSKFDTLNVRVLVVSKANFTGDNDITLINNTFLTIDQDNRYRPIILNSPDSLPVRVVGDFFAYKFLAYDPEDEDISWKVDELAFSGMDDLDAAIDQIITGNNTAGPYTLDEPAGASEICVRVNSVLLTAIDDYTTTLNQLTFVNYPISSIVRTDDEVVLTTSASHNYSVGDTIDVYGVPTVALRGRFTITEVVSPYVFKYDQGGTNVSDSSGTVATRAPSPTDVVEVLYISSTTGFDTILFDQGQEGISALGLQINRDTGWLYGTLPPQTADTETYSVVVRAFRTLAVDYLSDPVTFSLTVKRTRNEEIIWNTPQDLGNIDNGSISEVTISATNTVGKELEYSLVYEPYRRVPQGLRMLRSGQFVGKVTFRYFSLDSARGFLPMSTVEGIELGMSVQGVGVAAGCEVTDILENNIIEVRPAIYVVQGSPLTFSNDENTIVISTIANAISTVIDGGNTTFDQDCRFSVKAEAIDKSISSVNSFVIHVRPRNLAPFENLYLKALPKEEQRLALKNILEDTNIVPRELLYRPDDAFFGLQKNLKFLFLPGLSASKASVVINSISLNHYTKSLNFGNIRTARAVNNSGTIDYEVVYVDVIDNQQFDNLGPPLSVNLINKNKFKFGNNEYSTIYPNSFNNMQNRLEEGLGYSNRGALPRWMTSVQEDGRVLGLTRAVVLAYTRPGASKLVAYRLKNSGYKLNSIDFVVDRYQWDNYLSKFYDTETNRFLPSRDTTFDKYPNLGVGSDVITATVIAGGVTDSNTIVITDNLKIGYGWICTSTDTLSSIVANTAVRSVTLNETDYGERALEMVLSANLTAQQGAVVKFDGSARVDYAVQGPFSQINGNTIGNVNRLGLIDGITNFVENELIIFANQANFGSGYYNDGWVLTDGVTTIPGYLDKLSGLSTVNQRGGVWQMTWEPLVPLGFDNPTVGFDEASPGFAYSRFDQGDDFEIKLEFQNELNLAQTVKVRTGKSFPSSTLQYRQSPGEVVPRYRVFTGSLASEETTFDGGSCQCREGDPGKGGVRGGTAFSNNRDKYIIPESEDKYIKFPQNGVFV